MARKERNLIAWIFQNFITSLKPRKFSGELKGTDHFGNKYFEIPAGGNRRKRARYFEPIGKSREEIEGNFDSELPAEWESWLRGRRVDPPSEKEIMANYELMLDKKKKAEEIDTKFKGPRDQRPKQLAERGRGSFPEYPDYDKIPGVKNPRSEN